MKILTLISLPLLTLAIVGCNKSSQKTPSSYAASSVSMNQPHNSSMSSQFSSGDDFHDDNWLIYGHSSESSYSTSSQVELQFLTLDEEAAPWLQAYYAVALAEGESQPLTPVSMASLVSSFKAGIRLGLAKTYPPIEYMLTDGSSIDLVSDGVYEFFSAPQEDAPEPLVRYFPNQGRAAISKILTGSFGDAVGVNGTFYRGYHSSQGNIGISQQEELADQWETLADFIAPPDKEASTLAMLVSDTFINGALLGYVADLNQPGFGVLTKTPSISLNWIPDLLPIEEQQQTRVIMEGGYASVFKGERFAYIVSHYRPWLKQLSYVEANQQDLLSNITQNNQVIDQASLDELLPLHETITECYAYDDLSPDQGLFGAVFVTIADMHTQTHVTQCFAGNFGQVHYSADGLFLKDASEEANHWHFVEFNGASSGYQGLLLERDLPETWPSHLDL